MQRVLARVLDLNPVSRQERRGGFSVEKVLVKVKVEDKAAKAFRLPARTKGRVYWILREVILPWKIEKGDRIVLDPEEVRSLLCPLRLEPAIVIPEKEMISLRLSLHNPQNKQGLAWEVDPGSLGEKREGTFEESGLTHLSMRVRPPGEGACPIVAACGALHARAVLPVVNSNSTLSYSLDVNWDGFEEIVLENGYLRAVIVPHLGARLWSLRSKATGRDRFFSSLQYERGEYIEHGGSTELLGHEPPGELWDAHFRVAELGRSQVVLTHKWKGLQVEKMVEIIPSMPALYQRVTFSSEVRGEKEVFYWHRIPLAVSTRPWTNSLLIPTKEKLERVTYCPPFGWRRFSHYYGLTVGGILFHSGDEGEALLYLTEPETVEFVAVTFTRNALVGLVRRKPSKLKRGDTVSYSSLYILGEGYSVGKDSLAMISRGKEKEGRIPVFLFVRQTKEQSRISAKLSSTKGERSVKMVGRGFEGVGKVWVGKGSLRHSAKISGEIVEDHTRHRVTSIPR